MLYTSNMTKRSRFFIVVITLVLVIIAAFVLAKPKDTREYMAVMTASSATIADSKITLHDPSPNALVFADRPARDVRNVTPEDVAAWWRTEEFQNDLPNVAVTWHDDSGSHNQIVELSNPVFSDGTITFDYAVISAEEDNFTESIENISLFIDAKPIIINDQMTD